MDERPYSLRRTLVSRAGQDLGCQPSPEVRALQREHLGPIHARRLELPGAHLLPERRLTYAMGVGSKPVEDLPILEPTTRMTMHLGSGRLEDEHVATIL